MPSTELLIYAAGLCGLVAYQILIRRKLGQVEAGRAEGDADRMQRSLKLTWGLMGVLLVAAIVRLLA